MKKQDSRISLVRWQKEIAPGIFCIEIENPKIAKLAQPGQFVHVKTVSGWEVFWRRPFSIHSISEDGKAIQLIYRRIGKGTMCLSRLHDGDPLDVLGPLGQPFDLKGPFSGAFIVAGGLGIAPVRFLVERLLTLNKKILLVWGVKTEKEFFELDVLSSLDISLYLATEDGSEGFHGRVTDWVEKHLKDFHWDGFQGFGCGPMLMLKNLQSIVKDVHFPWQVSLEERMACGLGVCQGCGIRIREKGFQMVCTDGPVFNLLEVEFHGGSFGSN